MGSQRSLMKASGTLSLRERVNSDPKMQRGTSGVSTSEAEEEKVDTPIERPLNTIQEAENEFDRTTHEQEQIQE